MAFTVTLNSTCKETCYYHKKQTIQYHLYPLVLVFPSRYCSHSILVFATQGDNAKLWSAGGSPQCRLAEGLVAEELLGMPGLDADEFLSRVPENPWAVPEVPSPPTASGLYWQGNLRYPVYDRTMFVPEISSLDISQNHFTVSAGFKRRRREF